MSNTADLAFDPAAEARDPAIRVRRIMGLVGTRPKAIGPADLEFLAQHDGAAWGRAIKLLEPAMAATPKRSPKQVADDYFAAFEALAWSKGGHTDLEAKIQAFTDSLEGWPFCPALLTPFAMALRAINEKNVARNERIAQLEKRLNELEKAPRGLKYCGVHQRSLEYQRHDAVSFDGSIFCCVVDRTNAAPGSSNDWQLGVKRGRDGKDAR